MQKSTTINFLRAASVLYIVGFWHALGYTTAVLGYSNAITHRVTVVVLGLFVFLSGFLLASKDVSSFESIVTFYKRRLFRIWPLYILSLIVFVLCGLTSSKTALLSAVGISMFYGEQPMTLWFITMLLIFYALAPLLIRASVSPKIFVTINSVLFLIAAKYAVDPRLALYFPAFATGVFASKHRDVMNMNRPRFLGVAAVIAIIVAVFAPSNAERSVISAPMAALIPLLVLLLSERVKFRPHVVSCFSVLSYSGFTMYLFHRPIYMAYSPLFPPFPMGQLLVLWVVALPTVILISYIIQSTYDRLVEYATRCHAVSPNLPD